MSSSERCLLDELEFPSLIDSCAELKTIISEVNLENRSSKDLYKGKYQILLLENLLPWQKPIGQFFQTVIAIIGIKERKFSSVDSQIVEEESDGRPLPLIFDPLTNGFSSVSDGSSISIFQQLKEKYDLYPLSENVGKKLLNLCNIIGKEFQIPYPVVALCHGRNPKSVSIPGTLKTDKLVQVIVNTKGRISKFQQLPRLSSVKLAHLAGFVPSCTSIESSVYAQYNILEYESGGVLLPSSDMNVIIECNWSNPSAILEPISTDSSCFVKVKTVTGNESTGASKKFKEIKLIMALCEGLNIGIMKWPDFCSCDNLVQRIEHFMTVEDSSRMRNITVSSDTDLKSFDAVVLDERCNLDFTDKLWLILKDCSSSEDLKEAFSYVFEELNRMADLPCVYSDNTSIIADNIRNMREKSVSWPYLTSELALQMLLEIGVVKLRRDYKSIFADLELARHDSIYPFLQPEMTSSESVMSLLKLHSTLELIIVATKCLHLPKHLLCDFVRNVLKYYSIVPNLDLQHVFTFQIPPTNASILINQKRPTVWELSLLSSDKDFKKQSVHRFSEALTTEFVPKDYQLSYVYMTGTLVEDSFFVS